ncbi:hypothetical protein [Lysobacter hankyongensis]|uniref:Uncharacterized protein n=1 Tax=Lysobacter hankyongensis TaxID=1176535 RepID=A0ABP9C5Q6_9GAMM
MPAPNAFLRRAICLPLFAAVLCMTTISSVQAQNASGQTPNVRTEYAQVLRVEPVYQTLRAQAVEQRCDHPAEATGVAPTNRDCRPVRVERQFQRPVAYDVDYIHGGVKYRSRLPMDPGKRLRVRITVTPDMPPGERR